MKKTDEQIADGIVIEVRNTMRRIEESHKKADLDGELKSDSYSRMKEEGLWDAQTIINEYLLIKRKKSCYPTAIRQLCIAIFSVASTNYWAKQIKDEQSQKEHTKKKKRKPEQERLIGCSLGKHQK